MAGQNINNIIADVNYWAKYRDPDPDNYVPLNNQQVQAFYRLQNYQQPAGAAPQGEDPQYRNLGPGQPLDRPPVRDDNIVRRAFLDRNPLPQVQGNPAQIPLWQGKKFLGEGATARVGLWEYNDPADPNAEPPGGHRQIAVKELKTSLTNPSVSDFGREGGEAALLAKLRQSGSPHIVHLLHNPGPVGANENLPPGRGWDTVVRRIFLEYCSLGSLYDLLDRRIKLAVPFTELTIWRIFDCLLDGISVLQYGNELVPDAVTNQFYNLPMRPHKEIVHFDLKPDNILLTDKWSIHPVHPLCKISDFGLASEIQQPQADRKSRQWLGYYESKRKWGTEDYYAPEQFTKRWDYDDWTQLRPAVDIAGMYERTNIWGVGCIMYQLITMSRDPPDHRDPFEPQYDLRGRHPLGLTYGTDLPAYPYSDLLRHLVQECLYELPSNRPDLMELKENVKFGTEAALSRNPEPEPWIDFLPAEPLPPDVANPPALPVLPAQPTRAQKLAQRKLRIEARKRATRDAKKQAQTVQERERTQTFAAICRHFYPNNKQCGNKFMTDGKEIYCHEHGGLG